MSEDILKPDTKIREYAIKRVLGRGAFGVTYLAEFVSKHYAVAIKEYFPTDFATRGRDGTTVNAKTNGDLSQEFSTGLEKFLEESKILKGFDNPHIVRVVDTFELNGTAYMVMQYEEGGTLSQYLAAHEKPLDESQILSIFIPVLKGLKDIHAQWLLHRDIKPSNIYIRADGSPLLIDFGTARHALAAKKGGMTEYLTPGFAPSEQYDRSEDHGPWTDVYAVGATMYYCVTRITPPEGRRRIGVEDPMMPASQAAPSFYSKKLLDLIDWMVAPQAIDRPQDVDKVLKQLESMQQRIPHDATENLAETIRNPKPRAHKETIPPDYKQPKPTKQSPRGSDKQQPPVAGRNQGLSGSNTEQVTEPIGKRSTSRSSILWISFAVIAIVVVSAGFWVMTTSALKPSEPLVIETTPSPNSSYSDIGRKVIAPWEDGTCLYSGTVVDVQKGDLLVHLDFGEEVWVDSAEVLPSQDTPSVSDLNLGTEVYVKLKEERTWAPGTIKRKDTNRLLIGLDTDTACGGGKTHEWSTANSIRLRRQE